MSDESVDDVKKEEIHRLLENFAKSSYRVKGDQKVSCDFL